MNFYILLNYNVVIVKFLFVVCLYFIIIQIECECSYSLTFICHFSTTMVDNVNLLFFQ